MELTDAEFDARYGSWEPLPFGDVSGLLDPLTWWVVGGWALELATGVSRPHHDLDVAIPRSQLAAVTAHLADHHLWAPHRIRVPLEPTSPRPCRR